jgi:hypothetical protein
VRFRRGTECPDGLARLAARYFDRDGVLRPDAVATFHVFLSEAARFDHELRCYDDVLEFIAEARDADRRRAVSTGPSARHPSPPSGRPRPLRLPA